MDRAKEGYEAIRKQLERELNRLETDSDLAFRRNDSTDEYVDALVRYFEENEYEYVPILNSFFTSQFDTFNKTMIGIAMPPPMKKLWSEFLDFEAKKERYLKLQQFELAANHHHSAKTVIAKIVSQLEKPLAITPENLRDALRERGVNLPDKI